MTLRKPFLATLAFACLTLTASAQVIITQFGNNALGDGTWIYTPLTSTISGSDNLGNSVYGNTAAPDLDDPIALRLTGETFTAPTIDFSISLEDHTGKVATALFSWSSFVGGATITQPFNFVESGFNFANVVLWSLDSGGSTQAVNASFSQLAAVPEPAVTLLLAVALTFWLCTRRRRCPSL